MRNKLGVICMVLGAALIFGALSLFLHNQEEADAAQQSAEALMPQILAQIEVEQPSATAALEIPEAYLEPEDLAMKEVEIDGYGYIGYLSLPNLGLELPVMADWDYTRLQIAPCRYSGTVRGNDLVIMAHNYWYHFGRLSELSEGNAVSFTDMDGNVTEYEVVALDVLQPTAVEEMTAGEYDLALFTCTYGGQNRVTVYCDKVEK